MSRMNIFEQAALNDVGVKVKDGVASLVDLSTSVETDVAMIEGDRWISIHERSFAECFGVEIAKKLNREMRRAYQEEHPEEAKEVKAIKKA